MAKNGYGRVAYNSGLADPYEMLFSLYPTLCGASPGLLRIPLRGLLEDLSETKSLRKGLLKDGCNAPWRCLSTTPSEGTVGKGMFGLVFFHSRNRVLECAF